MTDAALTASESQSFPLRVAELNIGAGPWPCPEDKLGRDKEIENLSPVLLNAEAPLVFALDAPWGGGKTTFIKLWRHYLAQESQQKVSLYLNAWESDFSEDPLLALLSTFDTLFAAVDDQSTAKKAWENAKKCGPGLLKSTAIAATKAATFGGLDLDKEYEKLVAEITGGLTGSLIDSFNIQKATLARFKEQISIALDALPADQQNLIIFVDELDRCRPTYAIEVLERIKHLFDIDRVVFVLAINRDQLSKSLQGVYGPNFDGLHYLKRFIDLDYQLRVPDIESYVKSKLNLPDIVANFSLRNRGKDHLVNVKSTIVWLAARFSYQPRDIDQYVTRLRLIFRSIPSNHSLDTATLICMLFLREHNKDLYYRFKNDSLCVNEVIQFLAGEDLEKTKLARGFGLMMGGLLRSCYDEYKGSIPEGIMQYWKDLHDKLEESTDSKREVASLISQSTNFNDSWGGEMRQTAFERIELVSQIDVSV
jgi:hypothetical protein